MRRLVTTDNTEGYIIKDRKALEDLRHIADTNLEDLCDEQGNALWVFPRKDNRHADKIDDKPIFRLIGNSLSTENIMGFIGYGKTQLTIRSRFSNEHGKDWFMQYMLQKVFSINVFDLPHFSDSVDSLDINSLLFPYFLQKALVQGLYREYTYRKYNDTRIRGAIDIPRHIKENYPFKNGRVAYTNREFTYDNSITQLIRHTIEHIKSKKKTASIILGSSAETKDNINQIIEATPSYRKGDLRRVLLENIKPKIHPYYSEYSSLQRLCLQILRNEKTGYGDSKDKLYGVIFDGAWLWEEYLSQSLMQIGFQHPMNKEKEGGWPIYSNRQRIVCYPDFISDQIVADAKYKRYYKNAKEKVQLSIPRDDLYQMISYLHITNRNIGVFVCPSDKGEEPWEDGQPLPDAKWNIQYNQYGCLEGLGGEIHVICMNIPISYNTYSQFVERMTMIENNLCHQLKRVTTTRDHSSIES